MNEGRGPKRVRVVPRDDGVRRDIRHQPDGIRFPAKGSVEWPLDAFTKRRLRDGDVLLESAAEGEAREQARAESRSKHHRSRHHTEPAEAENSNG